jgi:hypothetical protein
MDKTANSVQVGGDHYKTKGLQPWDAIIEWKMGFLDGNALKYLVRFRDKGGVEDLMKARHYIDKLIEVETNEPDIKSKKPIPHTPERCKVGSSGSLDA